MKKTLCVSWILLLVFYVGAGFANSTAVSDPAWSASSEISNPSLFHIVPLDKIANSPVHWVTAGGGVLAFGAGQRVDLALEEDPYTVVASLSFDHIVSEGLIVGRYAFLNQNESGLRVLDLEDPSNPLDLGLCSFSGPISGATCFTSVSPWDPRRC